MATKKIAVQFSKGELIHLRRFLNRAVDCAEGKCFQRISAWYFAKPLLKKVRDALEEIRDGGSAR
jgi:hypothetical protein